jgi:K+/H+ antiporter YhaU regulatory subunit KhtT
METRWSLTVPPNATLSEMVKQMQPGTRPVFVVVRDGHLEGLIRVPDLSRFMREPHLGEAVIAADMMAPARTVAHPDDDLYHAMYVFRRHPFDAIPVVSRDGGGRWIGMLSRQRVFEIVQRHIKDLYRSALAEHSGLAAIEQEGQLAQLLMGVQPGHRDRIQRLPVPPEVIGQSLRQADFAQRYRAQVIAIEGADGAVRSPPDLDTPLSGEQTLVAIVLGSTEDE